MISIIIIEDHRWSLEYNSEKLQEIVNRMMMSIISIYMCVCVCVRVHARMVLNWDGEIKLGKTLRAYPSMTLYGTSKLRIEVYGNNYVMQEWRIC